MNEVKYLPPDISRKRKFKAWDHENKCWRGDDITIGKSSGPSRKDSFATLCVFEGFNNCTIIDFTGLIDRNGKEIYEGDIVKSEFIKPQVVMWHTGSCGFEPFSDSKENCGHCGGGLRPEKLEVIGNVFENPELI
jgi:uncharacterized phage protein (TIGR01671 family)